MWRLWWSSSGGCDGKPTPEVDYVLYIDIKFDNLWFETLMVLLIGGGCSGGGGWGGGCGKTNFLIIF